jgi:single-strand DNA-binding protein
MSDSTIKGAIKLINPIKVISDKFSVREFVVTTPDEKYPQDILFQTVNDKMAVLESLGVGQQVEVSYNIRGREFNGRYYNTLDAWKVEVIGYIKLFTLQRMLEWISFRCIDSCMATR